MRLPRPGRVLRLVLLSLVCLMATDICHARPQQQSTSDASGKINASSVSPEEQVADGNASSALGSWRSSVSETSSANEHQLHSDQDRSRVRLENGDDDKQRGGKIQKSADTQQVTATLFSNATIVETSTNNMGRAKHSSPMGDSIKSLASQLLDSQYFEKDSDEGETDSDEGGSDSMVDKDVRTPPKLKSQLKHKQSNQRVKLLPKTTEIPIHSHSHEDTGEEMNLKGIAVPVIIEDDEELEKTIEKLSYTDPSDTRQTVGDMNQKKKSTTTIMTTLRPYYESPSSDVVSTWVLLSGSSSPTTPSHLLNKEKTHSPRVPSSHKTAVTTPISEHLKTTSAATKVSYKDLRGTIEPYYHQGSGGLGPYGSTVTPSTVTRKPVRIGSPTSALFSETAKPHLRQNETLEILKLSKTRKPNPTRTTIKMPTTTAAATTVTTTSVPTFSTKLRPLNQQSNSQKSQLRGTTVRPTAVAADRHRDTEELLRPIATVATPENETTSSEENNAEDSSTDASLDTMTKRPGRPTGGNKKRKNNKNRRRRPSNKPEVTEDPESKTGEMNTTFTNNKVTTKERPLSTRIYNYLAREVMPSVGVGLIGLVVTAGLAGLIMYPFGGGLATRRTYEEQMPPHQLHPSAYYHHGEYDGEIDNSQSEEEVFGKLLEGMNDKGEFTYSGIGEETTGYAGAPGMDLDQDSRYKTTAGGVEDGQMYSSAGMRYGGVTIDSSQQGAASFAGSGKNEATYPYSHGSQHSYGSSLRAADTQDRYQYGGMATRSGGIGDSVRESQHLYSGTVNTAKKQYAVGSIHLDGKPHQHAGSRTTAYGGLYYTPSYTASESHALNAYGGLTATEGPAYGSMQVDSKQGLRHSANTEKSSEMKHKTISILESISAGNEQYRRGVSENRQQYRGGIDTQPRSGGSIITVSVTRQPGPRGVLEDTQTEQFVEHEHIEKISRNKQGSSQRKHEIYMNSDAEDRTNGKRDSKNGPGSLSDISSGISSEFQKTESLISGFVGHGPRSLRLKRDTNESTKFRIPDGDVRDNEIETNKLKYPVNRNLIGKDYQDESNELPTHLMLKNSVTLLGDIQKREGIVKASVGKETTETETSTVNGRVTNNPTEDTENVNTVTLPNESSTLENELPTTTHFNDYDTSGEYADIQSDEEYDTTISPEMTTVSNEISTKDADIEMTTKIPESQFSLLGFVRRIARFKLRMGLNLLKSTSQALTNYIERVQRRMDKDYNSSKGSSINARIIKRDT
ncbi:uncharacterized protein LOC111867800 isoform X2 [Cryptotermes secundus]|uniref:uncharacterized protein LOC111867800 isoform X2 n=1 Tax=Cryptotermes secundus TaxID=105785 RepID=UPI000CD7DCED|nr:uncharacterized protein LOC111867800 isoform X2 [Cryptotermes secundus]